MKVSRTKAQMGSFSFDGENSFPRIEKLLETYWNSTPEVDIERARIYTQSYQETEGEDTILRRAKGFKKLAIIESRLSPLIPKFAKSHITRPAGAATAIALPQYK